MADTVTYTPIATNTLGSAAASVTFSSISGTYKDLVLIIDTSAASGVSDYVPYLTFNSDSSSNYSTTTLRGSGTTASSVRDANQTGITMTSNYGLETSTPANLIVHIMNYSNSTTYKTVLNRYNSPSRNVVQKVALWRSTSAITSVIITLSGASFASGSTFTLYGIGA